MASGKKTVECQVKKMEGEKCIKCGWVINKPMSNSEVDSLLSATNLFISEKVSNRHAKEVIKKVKERIEWQKELNLDESSDVPICRYCLFELVKLYMKNEEDLFNEEFVKNYDFDEAIIS